ncbi:uncharacterized protein LOC120915981 [Rana temporaria]|uniref:uncharacterized protein LOC120915981 n=1 Tax=Rana temporaria TaxID=8407 RepID=UPI001AADA164|nr:uncharacterized protein LOC120915981 [Rana temporaria]
MPLQIFFFFWFIVCGTVEALKCNFCLEPKSDHCASEETIDCDDNDGCAAVSGFFQTGSERKKFIYKGCRFLLECDSWLCSFINGTYMKSYITCCDGKMCDLSYYVPRENDQSSGINCGVCAGIFSTQRCSRTQKRQCRRGEVLCMDHGKDANKPDGAEAAVSNNSETTIPFVSYLRDLIEAFSELLDVMQMKSTRPNLTASAKCRDQ